MFEITPNPRLLPSPVFLLSTMRSGSSLLRSVLDTHSQIHAPTELPFTEVGVEFLRFPAKLGMRTFSSEVAFGAAGLDVSEMEYLLWDRILHRTLVQSGKPVLVLKAPRLLLRWRRIAECWPEARYIFLLRHPGNVLSSMHNASGQHDPMWELTDYLLRFLYLLREARANLPGLTVHYESLTTDPVGTCQAICEFLDVDWEPGMLDYGATDHGPVASDVGDFSKKIQSGRIQPDRPAPSANNIPMPLRAICADLGYGTDGKPAVAESQTQSRTTA